MPQQGPVCYQELKLGYPEVVAYLTDCEVHFSMPQSCHGPQHLPYNCKTDLHLQLSKLRTTYCLMRTLVIKNFQSPTANQRGIQLLSEREKALELFKLSKNKEPVTVSSLWFSFSFIFALSYEFVIIV